MRTPAPEFFPPLLPLPADWRWASSVTEPGSRCDESCRRRHALAHELAHARHPDPEAARWQKAEQTLTRLLTGWSLKAPPDDACLDRWFGGRALELRYPGEPFAIMEWSVLGYRREPGDPTAAEGFLSTARFRNADLEVQAREVVAAPVTLLRVVAADPNEGMTLEPLCAPGPRVVVPDRATACIAHDGSLVGGRLLSAGKWRLLRPVGPLVAPAGAGPLLRSLDRALARRGATRERSEAVLRAEPELLSDLLAAHAMQ